MSKQTIRMTAREIVEREFDKRIKQHTNAVKRGKPSPVKVTAMLDAFAKAVMPVTINA